MQIKIKRALLFGPVQNSRGIFIFIHALYWLYQYPLYVFKFVPEIGTTIPHWLNAVYILNNIVMWILYYSVFLTEPGYIKQNTTEYQESLKKVAKFWKFFFFKKKFFVNKIFKLQITFHSQNFTQADWNKSLSKLCHTCKAIRPLRSSHCKCCNRCVLAFDHHCPYVQNCIGYNNRVKFFMFVFACSTLQILTVYLGFLQLSQGLDQYIIYPGFILVIVYGVLVNFLTFGAVSIWTWINFLNVMKFEEIFLFKDRIGSAELDRQRNSQKEKIWLLEYEHRW